MYRIIFLTVFVVATTAWAQEPPAENESATEAETQAVEAPEEDKPEDHDLDSQENHTDEDEDVFKPTDNVSYQQSVTFPVDI